MNSVDRMRIPRGMINSAGPGKNIRTTPIRKTVVPTKKITILLACLKEKVNSRAIVFFREMDPFFSLEKKIERKTLPPSNAAIARRETTFGIWYTSERSILVPMNIRMSATHDVKY